MQDAPHTIFSTLAYVLGRLFDGFHDTFSPVHDFLRGLAARPSNCIKQILIQTFSLSEEGRAILQCVLDVIDLLSVILLLGTCIAEFKLIEMKKQNTLK